MKVTMVIIDKCGVRGDATLCVVIYYLSNFLFVYLLIMSSFIDIFL